MNETGWGGSPDRGAGIRTTKKETGKLFDRVLTLWRSAADKRETAEGKGRVRNGTGLSDFFSDESGERRDALTGKMAESAMGIPPAGPGIPEIESLKSADPDDIISKKEL
ncbi:MAG: hypothetical protein C6W56_05525 [Caldibacillus debilis]|nr:hypothetical protein [Bacillaceae bacterium]OUM88228.1 MAG: hypothetical protein BAA03_15010 [Caldibacillus debilis]REJ29699.1 MAG: hypothetical protein C6W56_05525 [Caldibacillus debilis]